MNNILKEKIIKKLEKASLNKELCTFKDTNFSGINLNKLEINDGLFKDCIFNTDEKFISIYGCTFTKCEFLNCDFSNVDILNTKFIDCTFISCDFEKTNMKDVSFEGGYKSNNKFSDTLDVSNIYGLDIKTPNIISDSIEQHLADMGFIKDDDEYESYTIASDNVKLIITKDSELGENTWRIMIDCKDPETNEFEIILSDTVENENTIKAIIFDLLEYGLKKANNIYSNDYTKDFNIILNKLQQTGEK